MDPAQHSWTVLAAFIESLAGSEWAQLLDRRIAWERQAVEVRSRNCVVRIPSALMTCNANGTANLSFTKTFCKSLMFAGGACSCGGSSAAGRRATDAVRGMPSKE